GSFRRRVLPLAREIKHKRSKLKGPFFGFSQNARWFGLKHPQLVVPRIDLDASAERQSRNPVSRGRLRFRGRRLRGGHRRNNRQACGDSVPQVWADQVWDFLRTGFERLEEQLRRAGLLLVRRTVEQFVALLLGGLFLFRRSRKVKV